MTTVDCPHQAPAVRECSGCFSGSIEQARHVVYCDGETSGRVMLDSDGDAGVINGIRHFLTVEDLVLSCGCTLTPEEEQKVTDALCEAYAEGDDERDPDEAYNRMRERDDDYYAGLADAQSY